MCFSVTVPLLVFRTVLNVLAFLGCFHSKLLYVLLLYVSFMSSLCWISGLGHGADSTFHKSSFCAFVVSALKRRLHRLLPGNHELSTAPDVIAPALSRVKH